jgi:hypothetical protein
MIVFAIDADRLRPVGPSVRSFSFPDRLQPAGFEIIPDPSHDARLLS